MREILFRGKRVDNGEWIYGDLLHDYWIKDGEFIETAIRYEMEGFYSFPIEVIHETVGQYTGLLDKNGNKIFEGDIVKIIDILNPHLDKNIMDVKFENGGFNICNYYGYDKGLTKWFRLEIIGNIHDNQELLNQ